MKEFDIIKHPLKVDSLPQVRKVNGVYEVGYGEDITFEYSTSGNYLHIEVQSDTNKIQDEIPESNTYKIQDDVKEDNTHKIQDEIPENTNIKIHGYGKKLFTMKIPLGFKTFDNQTTQFDEIISNFHNQGPSDTLAASLLTNNKPKFNFYFPDEGNKNPIFNYDFTNLQASKNTETYTVYYKYSDPIPLDPSEEYLKFLKTKEGNKFNEYYDFLKERIQYKKIFSSSIINEFKLPEHLNGYTLKKYLPLFAYYAITGPWKKLWIRFGFDPKKDIKVYKCQRIPIRKIGKSSQLINFPDLINEIEKNPTKYLQEECEYERGFIKQEGIELIKRYLNEKIITKTTFDETSSETEASDFEILI